MESPFKSKKYKSIYENYIENSEKRWPVESENVYIDTSYGPTHVRICGAGDPLVLLPCFQASSLCYSKIVKQLSEKFKIFAIDTIGDFGKSYLTSTIESTRDFVLWQEEVYEELNISDGFNLLGTSHGGWLALLYASEFDNVNKLILISPAAGVANINKQWLIRGLCSDLFPFTKKNFFKWMLKDLFKSNHQIKSEINDILIGPSHIKTKCLVPMQKPQLPVIFSPPQMRKIKAKTLFFTGGNENLYNPFEAKEYFDMHILNGESELIMNTGHDLFFLKSEYIANKVINFILRR